MRKSLRDKYLGAVTACMPSWRDPTISTMALPKDLRNPAEGHSLASGLPFTGFPGSLNANLACQESLFNVIPDTIPAPNVTHFTRNGGIAPD